MRHESRQRKIILEVKRRFVRFVSHEILTPLNTVCLGLELLQSELKPEKERESHAFVPLISGDMKSTVDRHDSLDQLLQLTDDILENANNAVDILNDLLNYDKIQQGTFKLEIGTVHVWELVRATVSAFHIQAEKRKVSLSLKTGTQLTEEGDAKKIELNDLLQLHVVGDDTRLRQVIRNLISNSLKFSPEKTGVIEVTTEHNPKGLHLETGAKKSSFPQPEDCGLCTCIHPCVGSVLITVKDNGVGMTREQLGRLFQEGVQFEANKHQVR